MLNINHLGSISKRINREGLTKLNLDEVAEKEILLVITAKLHSIRGMLIYFTIIITIGLIGAVILSLLTFAK